MSECSCEALPRIKQGDECCIGATVYFNGAAVTANELDLIDEIEYCFADDVPKTVRASEAWSAALGMFLLPVTQAQSFLLAAGHTNLDLRVKFFGGSVLGARQRRRMRVLPSNSTEVI